MCRKAFHKLFYTNGALEMLKITSALDTLDVVSAQSPVSRVFVSAIE